MARNVTITNCHVHTFTHKHVPDRFVHFRLLTWLLRQKWFRVPVLGLVRRSARGRRTRLARYARVVEVSHGESQEAIFLSARSYYPSKTRFVVLPMDMERMQAGSVEESIAKQHEQLLALTTHQEYRQVLIPFAAADPRRPDVVESTKRLLEKGFRGIKLYPPLGYHPNHPRLSELYAYAAANGFPVMTHCSRPGSVQFRGEPDDEMRTDPLTGELLDLSCAELLELFTDPDSYVPILQANPKLKLCLAHFGGAGEWRRYLEDPWGFGAGSGKKSWLAKILELLPSYPNLFTDISYTVFAEDDYVYMLKVVLSQGAVAERVLFGSDFYVVEEAKNEERRISMRIRAELGEGLFRQIAEDNPRRYLDEPAR